MRLLELEHVRKSYGAGSHRVEALQDVSLELLQGELVAIWGLRGSGRSTLLRLAAGIEPPDSGAVRVGGQDLVRARRGGLPPGVAYCPYPGPAHQAQVPFEARSALEEVMVTLLARGLSTKRARARSLDALNRAHARGCADLGPGELSGAEAARVTIARALCLEPSLLLLDEPTSGADLLERDGIFALLRSLAREDGIAVLTTVGESAAMFGIDRGLTLSEGELHGALTPELAPVLGLPLRESA